VQAQGVVVLKMDVFCMNRTFARRLNN